MKPPTVKPANTRSRLSAGLIAALLVLGWLALFVATDSPLLAAIQAGMTTLHQDGVRLCLQGVSSHQRRSRCPPAATL